MTQDKSNPASSRVHVEIGEGGEAIYAAASERRAHRLATAFVGYAGPMMWGADVVVASHIGSVKYTISYEVVGDTLVLGRVTYFKGAAGGIQVTEEFKDETSITTAKSVANVICSFKGIPIGSAVSGTVEP